MYHHRGSRGATTGLCVIGFVFGLSGAAERHALAGSPSWRGQRPGAQPRGRLDRSTTQRRSTRPRGKTPRRLTPSRALFLLSLGAVAVARAATVNLSVDGGTINLDKPGYSPKEYAARRVAERLAANTELCHRGQRLAPDYAQKGNPSFTRYWIDTARTVRPFGGLSAASLIWPWAFSVRATLTTNVASPFCSISTTLSAVRSVDSVNGDGSVTASSSSSVGTRCLGLKACITSSAGVA